MVCIADATWFGEYVVAFLKYVSESYITMVSKVEQLAAGAVPDLSTSNSRTLKEVGEYDRLRAGLGCGPII
jgi:hypothetical protein